MRKVKDIERQIRSLTHDEYAELRDWFLEEDAKSWDAEIEADVIAGKLDALGAAARRARAEGGGISWFWIGTHADYDKRVG